MTCTDTSTPCPSNRTLQITLTDPCQPDITGTVTRAVTDAMTAHKADPDAHPELKQVRRAVTDAGMAYDPTNAAQLSQAITKAVESIDLSDASETAKGIVRLATAAEATAGTRTDTAVHPAGLKAAVAALVNGAPGALDTLKELADALGNDANFAATITNALATKAPLASPVLTGTPTAPTAAAGNNSQQIATTAFVQSVSETLSDGPEIRQVRRAVTDAGLTYNPADPTQLSQAIGKAVDGHVIPDASETVKGIVRLATAAETAEGVQADTAVHPAGLKAAIAALINGAPGALDTLKELADALGNDANFAATITNALATKAPLASPVLTGTPTAPTAAAGNNSQQIATTAFVRSLFDGLSDRSVIPVGTESLFPGTTPPAGWLVEDGALVSRATYPDLWAFAETSGMIVSDTDWRDVIANRSKFSTGDGSTTFRLPNLITSGLFIRAQDPADADFGRRQEDDFIAHSHAYGAAHTTNYGLSATGIMGVRPTPNNAQYSTTSAGGVETRPKNAGRLPIIKAFSASVTNSVNGGSVDLAAMTSQLESLRSRIDSLPFTHSYQSSEIAFPDTVLTQTLNHGLGAKPKLVQAVLVCKSAEHGFSVGDEVVLHGDYSSNTQYTLMSTNSTASTVTLNIKCSGGFVFAAYPNDSTSTLTKENWNVLIRAWA